MGEFSVVFMTRPQVGSPVRIAYNGTQGQTDPVVSVEPHPTQPNMLKVTTRSGAVCVGAVDPTASAYSSGPYPGAQQAPPTNTPYQSPFPYYGSKPRKDKLTAGILAILLGWLGVHKFYMGDTWMGVLYIFLCIISCSTIPAIIGLIEGIIYLCMNDYEWDMKYNQ